MRVLHCIHSLMGGGAETQLRHLSVSIARHGWEVGIFCVDDTGKQHLGSEVSVFRSESRARFNIGLFRDFSKVVSEYQPDLIHAWLPASLTIPVMIVSRMKGVSVVFSYRNLMSFHRGLSYFEFMVATLCATTIVSNNLIEQSTTPFRWLYGRKSGTTIPNCVRLPSEYVKSRPSDEIAQPLSMVFVGRLTKQKNVTHIIEALSLVEDIDWRLDIYGVGELQGMIEQDIDRRGLSDRVSLCGYSDNVYSVMQEADVMILPSLHEGMPNVLVEALAVGLPCLVSDIPSHRWVLDTSYEEAFFPIGAPKELAEKIEACSNAGVLGALSDAGKAIASKYTIDAMRDAYAEIYERLARGAR